MGTAQQKPALDFYFEFASPYAYFASLAVEELCGRYGLALAWRPLMLGAVFKRTGAKPLLTDGVRGEYATMDCLRWAKRRNIPFRLPELFPLNSLKAARGALVLGEKPCLVPYIHACFRAYWVEGKDIFQEETLGEIVTELGEDAERFFAAIGAEPIKQRLKEETEVALQRGVFGAPTFFYGSEMVWGNDRLPLLEEIIREDRAVV
ncbi:MAG: 2-hydroxychromene-2-carboxylate isomerase [SAR324 cluster bacterium]|nr:2-hydroxychromene-2-carboxylate isomerase [SAR324 cluster bacterium]